MVMDSLPPFVTFLLPTPKNLYGKRRSLARNSSSTGFSCHSTSSASSSNTTLTLSPVSSSFTEATCSSPSSCSSSHNSLDIKQSLPTSSSTRTHLTSRYPSTLRCQKCSTDLAYTTQILSKGFNGRLGRAYLVAPPPQPPYVESFPPKPRPKAELVNTRSGPPASRELLTGWHFVADVTCVVCSTMVGWKYLDTREKSQRYKIGKVILERERVYVGGTWEDEEIVEGQDSISKDNFEDQAFRDSDSAVQFDSDNEEERESLFSGLWDRDQVAKRRSKMLANRRASTAQVQI